VGGHGDQPVPCGKVRQKILAAVAVVVFIGYQLMGTTITTLLSTVDGKL
jgi:hypothetical protein